MAARSVSRTKPIDHHRAIACEARRLAKQEARRRIRARGEKLSHYLPKDITLMSFAILAEQPEPFVARARETIARWIAADQKSEHMRNSRRPASGGLSLNETRAQNGAAK